MSNVSNKNTGRNAAILAAVAILAVAGGALYFGQNRPVSVAPDPQTLSAASPGPEGILPSDPPQQEGSSDTKADRRGLFVFTVATDDSGSHLERIPLAVAGSGEASNADEAVRALNTMAEQGESSPLPKGTRARSVTFEGDLATVDFSEAFQKNFTGGDENEALALNAAYATLGQFPGVRQVQILVEGQKIDSLGGNQPLTDPQPVPNNPALAQSETQ
ncbi:MAG: GerMN domain-containing protein [Cytophagales bacterium]|nr:GerMN domain-containing protein [Armatimonadota bacterium]